MSRLMKERLKSIFIFVLIISGLLQVGIQWSYQNQGTPTSFLWGLFNNTPQISDTVASEKLFVPERLILSDGDKSHWILGKDSTFYDDLWKEAKQGLKGIASGTVGLKPSGEDWGDVAGKRGFLIDFGYVIDPELLNWFLGLDDKKPDLPAVYKLMIKPDIIDRNMGTFYICSSGGKVYVSEPVSYKRANDPEDILSSVSDDGAQEYRNYRTLRDDNIDKTMDAEPDVLYVSVAPRYWPYFEYRTKPPARAEKKDELARIILGTEKDRYNNSEDNENTIQYTYGSNIYEYYTDGYLVYRYLGNTGTSGKGEVGKALLNAYKLVARVSEISEGDADIILTSVEEKQQGVFEFGFDYKLKGMCVKMEVDLKDGSGQKLPHAISIQADSTRVLKCDWLLRDFVQGAKSKYNDRFTEVLAQEGIVFSDIKIQKIQDIHSGYFIHSGIINVLKPMLLIDKKDKTTLQIIMPAEKGD